MGCMGLRSPGRRGGRLVGAPGRGRWKMGCPGTGRPGAGRIVAPAGGPVGPAGAAGRKGALYTGRGPVCGTIIRGDGATGCTGVLGAAGLEAMAGGWAGGAGGRGVVTDGVGLLAESGGAGGGTAGRGAAGGADGGGACIGAVKLGRGVGVGTTSLGEAAGGGAAGLGAGVVAAGGAAETADLTGGGTVRGASTVADGCCLLMMAFNASPGLEIWERSILVLISSASARVAREGRLEVCAELPARRRARTFSASWSSRELEWLFFSVTPISGSTSRIDLLLTSSSLARSLIRILLIRPFVLRTVPLSLHINLTASVFRFAQPMAPARVNRTYCFSSEGAGSSADSAATSCPLFPSPAASADSAL